MNVVVYLITRGFALAALAAVAWLLFTFGRMLWIGVVQ